MPPSQADGRLGATGCAEGPEQGRQVAPPGYGEQARPRWLRSPAARVTVVAWTLSKEASHTTLSSTQGFPPANLTPNDLQGKSSVCFSPAAEGQKRGRGRWPQEETRLDWSLEL